MIAPEGNTLVDDDDDDDDDDDAGSMLRLLKIKRRKEFFGCFRSSFLQPEPFFSSYRLGELLDEKLRLCKKMYQNT